MQVKKNRTSPLESPIRYIKGVGPARAKLFSSLDIHSIKDLFYYIPRRYEDRSSLKKISELAVGSTETVRATVLTKSMRASKKGKGIFQLVVGDQSGVIQVTWFNQPYMKDYFKEGQEVIFYGKIEMYFGRPQIVSPDYEILAADSTEDATVHTGRIVPIYPLTQELRQRYIRTIAKRAIDQYCHAVCDFLPASVKEKHRLMPLSEAIEQMHFPRSSEGQAEAQRRLVFDEFFLLQLGIAIKKSQVEQDTGGIQHTCDGPLYSCFRSTLPFTLTGDQQRAIDDITHDLVSPQRMNRLLQGDVGSGKTVVAACAMTVAIQGGYQVACMAPTEILAEQHYFTLRELFEDLGIRICLMTSATLEKDREFLYEKARTGKADIIIGTHALIQEGVEFRNLGLVIIDEQHKFGVMQRAQLQEKGLHPDVLIMTATPIPRTLALTVYGDLNISTLRELPPGRGSIVTRWFKEDEHRRVYELVEAQLREKRQAYIVYPLVEESEKLDVKAATAMYEVLKNEVLADFVVGLLHGRMSSDEKEYVMRAFKQGEIDVLVSTVVIEVGIDIPNATVIVIENAHRFGLSQLHQLRGRVGRGTATSYCFLISDDTSDVATARLQVMTETTDGFKIAEEDLRLRGPGEFFGVRQHGLPELRIANIIRDAPLLERAREEAFELIHRDRLLQAKEHGPLREELLKRFQGVRTDLVRVS
ncbi:MAG: ATP-dependent DNA helicase RecG [Candidatus Omnitrophica bacterium]|nr:ATP-dependent DNA helicase RecG [Candidatus Omnitrophota bacterium]